VTMDGRRREDDLADLERQAEATWIADRVRGLDRAIDPGTVASILRIHREYLSLPPPDRIIVEGGDQQEPDAPASVAPRGVPEAAPAIPGLADAHADGEPDDVRDDRRRGADEDLPPA
jgi:hypothetical protein